MKLFACLAHRIGGTARSGPAQLPGDLGEAPALLAELERSLTALLLPELTRSESPAQRETNFVSGRVGFRRAVDGDGRIVRVVVETGVCSGIQNHFCSDLVFFQILFPRPP